MEEDRQATLEKQLPYTREVAGSIPALPIRKWRLNTGYKAPLRRSFVPTVEDTGLEAPDPSPEA